MIWQELKAVKHNLGQSVDEYVQVLKIGKSLGFTEVKLYRESDNKLAAIGRHTKAL